MILTVIFLLTKDSSSFGYSMDSRLYNHFIYMFYHANIFHLIGNCYALYFVLNNGMYKWKHLLLILYSFSVLASFVPISHVPTIGFSAPIFVMIGLNFYPYSKKSKIITLFIVAVGFIFPEINAILHVICLLFGFTFSYFFLKIKSIVNDCKRIS